MSEEAIEKIEQELDTLFFDKAGNPVDELAKGVDPDFQAAASASLKQDDDPFTAFGRDKDIIQPPIKFELWAKTPELNTRLSAGIRIIARNTVGLGYDLVPKLPVNEDTPKEILAAIEEEKKRINKVFDRPNNLQPLSMIWFLARMDEETVGNGYIEIVRGGGGDIVAMYHVEAPTVRILKLRSAEDYQKGFRGFVQMRGQQKVYFKMLGDDRIMRRKDGLFLGEPDPQNDNKPVEGPIGIQDRATEIMHLKMYSVACTWYGLPRYMPAILAITGSRSAAQRNHNFFENDATPRMAVLVSGGRLSPTSVDDVKMFLKGGKGVANAHRVMVLQADKQKAGTGLMDAQNANTKIELHPLTVGQSDDMSFERYRRANDEEVREALGLAEAFFTTSDVNRASASVGKKITDDQEFEPDRVGKEHLVNHLLLPQEPFKAQYVEFKFKRPDLSDPQEKAEVMERLTKMGAITPNEARRRLGLDPYPSDFLFGDKPLPITIMELQMGVAAAIEGNDPPPPVTTNSGANVRNQTGAARPARPTRVNRSADEWMHDLATIQKYKLADIVVELSHRISKAVADGVSLSFDDPMKMFEELCSVSETKPSVAENEDNDEKQRVSTAGQD